MNTFLTYLPIVLGALGALAAVLFLRKKGATDQQAKDVAAEDKRAVSAVLSRTQIEEQVAPPKATVVQGDNTDVQVKKEGSYVDPNAPGNELQSDWVRP